MKWELDHNIAVLRKPRANGAFSLSCSGVGSVSETHKANAEIGIFIDCGAGGS